MTTKPQQESEWQVDAALSRLIGQDVRVAATSFSPVRHNEDEPFHLTPVRHLCLSDDDQPAAAPVYFEGRLQRFTRRPGAVLVWLGPRTSTNGAPDGPIYFRGSKAVIVQGPALVELALPFHVEALLTDPKSYWRDIHTPDAQLEFSFAAEKHIEARREDLPRLHAGLNSLSSG